MRRGQLLNNIFLKLILVTTITALATINIMAANRAAPKQWPLTKIETITSFENWRQNFIFTLSTQQSFAPFVVDGFTWLKKTTNTPLRGLTDDDQNAPNRRTAQQKVIQLELMLQQIANYCPIISRNTIVKNSTSLNQIWQSIRLHYGFQLTGAHFLDLADIKLQSGERPEDLFQRINAFVEDNLLKKDNNISHHGEIPEADEDLSPTLENMIVLTWLKLIHEDLPRLVKQRYGPELRSKTLATLKPEISMALDSLLDEIRTSDSAKILRTAFPPNRATGYGKQVRPNTKICPLCKASGRTYNHFLSKCTFLPQSDKQYFAKVRQLSGLCEEADDQSESETVEEDFPSCHKVQSGKISRVNFSQTPYFPAFFDQHSVRITVDTGAETDIIKASFADLLNIKVFKTDQTAYQADGITPMNTIGEIHVKLSRNNQELFLDALVVTDLDVDILGGVPFMEKNDISVRPAKKLVQIGDNDIYYYSNSHNNTKVKSIRRACQVLRTQAPTTLWPGDYIELEVPDDMCTKKEVAIEPRSGDWPEPCIIEHVARKVRLVNNTNDPLKLKKNDHVANVLIPYDSICRESSFCTTAIRHTKAEDQPSQGFHSDTVSFDPDNMLAEDMKVKFRDVTREYDAVFDTHIVGYNGAKGPLEAVVNMGPVLPPQRKGRMPLYPRDKLDILQRQFDELESMGVFKRPEDLGITVEYLNPSFLIKKPNGSYRLVTAFTDVGRYSKPQPSLMPDIDSTLRRIASWRHIIVTDLTKSFYQIPLSKESMRFCGVSTPFKGIRVYARSAMGMPGSETALEELMCRMLGDLVQEGYVAKIADDLYVGGDSPEHLLINWKRVLTVLDQCNIRLSAPKTKVNPKSTTILGWIWSGGSIRASQHKIATLESCSPPETVKGLRAFIGAYKMLARVLPNCAKLLGPFDDICAGQLSCTQIVWNENKLELFKKAQKALSNNKAITIPRPSDKLWIVTDGSVKENGIGSTLYVNRNDKTLLAGFFSAKTKNHQVRWLPCEMEALSIATSIKHFSPYIIQSIHKTNLLTDSDPCVKAFKKLCRGEFSASPRVTTFLTQVSHYQVVIQHLAGSVNKPSDFSSRNAPPCDAPHCQVCSFVNALEESVVRNLSVQDVTSGNMKLPFTNRAAWMKTQMDCPDIRRAKAHLRQGTRPSKKITTAKDVKRYLNVTTIAKDGLLIVRRDDPLAPTRELIVVPREAISGLLSALHIKFNHPTKHQLKQLVLRYFYALDMDKIIEITTESCTVCSSLQKLPKYIVEQSTSDPPETVGSNFAADVIKRNRQLILILRETTTSYTSSCIIEDEKGPTLRDHLIQLCLGMRSINGPHALIRVDPAPGFSAITEDSMLKDLGINIEIGRTKNANKNPVAEKAVREIEDEMLRFDPTGGPVTALSLSVIIARLNSRIRNQGLSSSELFMQRDQFTHEQIPVNDREVISKQHSLRSSNHPYSEMSKAKVSETPPTPSIKVGDLVMLRSELSKSCARFRYLVVSLDGEWCNIRKFTGNQLRSNSYRVKLKECILVPNQLKCEPRLSYESDSEAESESNEGLVLPTPPNVLTLPSASDDVTTSNIPVPEPTEETSLPDPVPEPDDQESALNLSECGTGNNSPIPEVENLRRSGRNRRPPDYYRSEDYC